MLSSWDAVHYGVDIHFSFWESSWESCSPKYILRQSKELSFSVSSAVDTHSGVFDCAAPAMMFNLFLGQIMVVT
eukprot:479860-Pelagomonas_calceolata.AAC.2